MQTQKVDNLIQKMADKWTKAYADVQPGQAYPTWFDAEQLRWIREALEDEGLPEEGKPSTDGMASERYWLPKR